ncbi:Ig-like domain-containing protein [Pseudomonas nicosulfuronedens]
MAIENIGLVAVTENAAKKVAVKAGGKIKAQAGTKYLLQVENNDVAPENVTVKRVGKDLLVQFEGSEKPDLTIQDFFADGMDSQLYGVAEDGQLYAYVRTDGEGFGGQLLLADGESAPIALGGDALADGAPYLASTFDDAAGFVLWPWLLGLAGIGAAAAAIIHHNQNDDHHHGKSTSPAPTNTKAMDDVGPIQGQLHNGDITDDSHPAISGNGVPGAIIHVFDNGQEIGSTTVQPDGTWSFTPELADGAHSIDITQEVPGQKPSAPIDVVDITVDTTPPAAPTAEIEGAKTDGGETYSNDDKPIIHGDGEPGDKIIIVFPTGETVETIVADDGTWVAPQPTQPLPEGNNDIKVIEQDPAGNQTEIIVPVIIDTIAPTAPEVHLDPASDTGIKGDDITSDTKPTIDGKTEPGADVTVTFPNGEEIHTKADENGDWSVTPTQPLPEGNNDITVIATDPAGNQSEPTVISVVIDTTAPTSPEAHLDPDSDSGIKGDDITNDTKPTIDGKTEPGAEVTVTFPTGEVATTTADANGDWHVTPTQPLPEGNNDITIIATDPAGNQSEPTVISVVIDTQAPDAPDAWLDPASDSGTKGDNITNDTKPTIDGQTEPGADVTVTFPTGEVINTKADDEGNWHVTPTQPLPEGSNDITVIATDPAGNQSEPTTVNVVIDSTAPDADKLAITGVLDDVGLVTGNIENGGTTDDSHPTISGTGTAGDLVTVYTKDTTGNHPIGSTVVGEDGKWSLTPELPINVGLNELTAVETDVAGNATTSQPYDITLDMSAPNAPTIESVYDDVGPYQGFLQKGDVTDDNKPTFNGSAEAGSTVKLYDGSDVLIGSAIADGNGHWSITPATALADGQHEVYATATNPVGVVSEPTGLWPFSVDTSAPANVTDLVVSDDVGAVTGPLHDGDTTDDNRPEFSGDAEPGSKVIIYDNGEKIGEADVADDGTWSFTPTEPLADGEHAFTTEVVDEAGNNSGQNDPLHVIVDTRDVVISITHVIDDVGSITGDIAPHGVTDDVRPEIQGTGKSGSTITVYDGEVELGTTTVDAKGNWSFTPTADLAEGAHEIRATATDKSGNVSEPAKFDFSIDTTAPNKPSIDQVYDDVGAIQGPIADGGVTDDSTPTISGKAEAGSIVTVYDNGEKLGSVTADKDGDWSYTPTTPLSEGAHEFTVDATDKAGNTSAKSDPFDIVTDYTAPDMPTITGVLDSVGEVTGNIPNGGKTDDSRPVISGEGTAGDTITVYANDPIAGNHPIGSTTVGEDGKWSLTPETPLNVGLNDLTAVETDAAGNSTKPSDTYSFDFDPKEPGVPVIVNVLDDVGPYTGFLQKGDVTDDNKPTINGTAEAGSTVKLYDGNNVLIGSTTADADGNWSITPATALADGKHDVYATATNDTGVVSPQTGKWDFIVDTSAPDNVTNLVVTDDVGAKTGQLYDGDTTDDNRPTFSGDAEPNGKVIIYDNGNKIGEADVDADGKWSFEPTAPLKDGDHAFTTEVLDEAGNSSGQNDPLHVIVDTSALGVVITHVIDDVGSITGDIAANGVTDDKRPEIQGTSKPGSIVKIFDGSVVLGSTTADAKGNWSFTPSKDLAEGPHNIAAIATDKAGNVSDPAKFHFTVDTTAPTKPTIDSVTDDVGSIQGPIANGGVTDDSTPTISGKAEAGSTVVVYDNGQKLGSVVADADGKWSYTPTTPISEGKHDFTADATDKAGNTSPKSDVFTIITDYTAPDADKLAITGVEDHVGTITGNIANGGTTDDPRPVIHGTGTAGDIVTVYSKDATGNHLIGSAVVDADGTWSMKPELPLVSGLNDLTAVETDPAGNATAPTDKYSITLDATAPQAPVIVSVYDDVGPYQGFLQKGDVTDDNKPTITGTAQAGSTVKLYDGNNALIGSTTADAKGNWTITTSELADGKHEVYATATNSVGVVSDPTGKWDFIVDTSAPDNVTNLVVTDDVGNVTGPLHDGDTTDDNRPTFSGDAEPNGKVIIYDNGEKLGEADVDADGKWEFTPTTGLDDGKHEFTTEVLDEAGNSSGQNDPLHVIVDTSGVGVVITHVIDDVGSITGDIAANGVTDDKRPEIQGTSKPGSIVKIFDGSVELGSTTADSKGNWSFTPKSDLAEGAHSIQAIATDKAGVVSDPAKFDFTVDTTAPNKPTIDSITDDVGSIQGPIANGGVTDDSTPTLAGKAEAGSVVVIYDNGDKLGSTTADKDGKWTYTPTTPISEGEHKFDVTATDKAGNTSPKSDVFTIITDYTAPDASKLAITGVEDHVGTITGNIANGGTTDDPRPAIHGTGTAGDIVTVYSKDTTGNHKIGSAVVDADGKWSMKPELPLVSGLNDLTAVESDPAGNATAPTDKYSITLDTSAPQAPVIVSVLDDVGPYTGFLQKGDVTDDNKPTIAGTAQAGSVVRLYDNNDALIGSTTADAKGNWSITPATAMADGKHEVYATATNSVGVVSDPTGKWDFSIDTSKPSNVTDLVVTDNVGDVTGALHDGDTTDDNRPTFSGDAEPNGKVIIYDNGVKIGEADVGADGKWEFKPTTALDDGKHDFTTEVLDKAGNSSGQGDKLDVIVDTSGVGVAITHVIDDVGSITGDIASGGSTDDKRPEIQGTTKAGSIVKIYDGSVELGSTTADSKGNWSFTPTQDLAEGAHSIQAIATDKAGVVSDPAKFDFSVDTTAPTKPSIESITDDVGSIQGPIANGGVTDDSTPTLAGKAEAGSIVVIYDNGAKLGSTTADKDGKWSYTPTTPLNEGEQKFTVDATDKAGNTSAKSDPFTIITDYSGPDSDSTKLTIDNVTSDNTVNSAESKGNVTVSGKVTGEFTAGDKVSFKLDGTTYSADVKADGTWSVAVPGSKLVDNSSHEIDATLVAHDVAGNAGTITAEHSYNVALNNVSITSMSKDSAIDVAHSTDFITADGSAGRGVYGKLDLALASGEKVQVSFDGGTTWVTASTSGLNWTAVDTTAHTGNWTIQARVVDGSGSSQTDVASQNVSFLGNQGGAPTITNIPDADSTYTTAKAADGSDVKVSLAGTIAKAGDTLHIVWGDTTFDHVLTAAEITAGTVTVTVPAQQTVQQGAKFDFAVTAQIISLEGQISSPSAVMQVHGEGWTTPATDTLLRTISTQGTSSVYQGGGFTITSNTTLSHYAGDTVSNAGVTFSGATTNYAQVNFTQPVDNFSIRISSLESTGSRVVVYDVDGNVLSDQQVKPDGTGGKTASKLYSFEAPIGADIGKVVVYCDGGGVVLDKLNYSQIHHAPGYIDTFANEIGKSGSFYSADGHFQLTATGKVSVLSDGTLYIGNPSVHENMNTSSATLTFDKPVQYISYDITAVEPGSGNGSLLQVYDTNGNLIFSRLCTNSGVVSGFEQISYTAPEGLSIGKVVIWNDDWGMKVDNFTSVLAPDVPTGQHEIDHGWETYFDEHSATYSEANYGQSFTVSAFSGGATLAGYHSAGGAFTITGAATKTAGGGTLWPTANQGSMFVDSAKTGVVTFDSARSEVSVSATGIEKGNTAYLKVYDTDGTLLDTIQMTNPTGTYDIQSFSYEAEGNVIGRIEITGDTGGTAITSISSQVTQATTENDVISMVVDPVAYFAQDSAHIHGSSGLDTLKLTGANQVLDLTKLTGDNDLAKISSIEKFDITGTGNNTLKISLNDVLNLGETDLFHKDGKVQVMVDGDAGDKVQLANLHDHGTAPGAWQAAGTASIGGSTYNVYSYSNLDAEVLIKQAVTASIV